MDNTRQNVVSQGKRREVSVRDVDRHEGKEVGDGKQEERQQPFKNKFMLLFFWILLVSFFFLLSSLLEIF